MNNWIELEEKHGTGVYGNWPVALDKGKGSFVWDTNGKKYLDFGSGLGVVGIGHANDTIADAISRQSLKLTHAVNGYYASPVRANFLSKLSAITPNDLDKIFLTNSGTEAVEAALKIARSHTGKSKIIGMIRGYHGRSMGSLSVSWKKENKRMYEPLIPEIIHVPYGKIDKLNEIITNDFAAVILEPIQGEGGVIIPPDGYLKAVREVCNENGVLMIMDEIQTGIGRTGYWFGCEHEDVIPDIICSSKMLGGGIPIGAMIASSKISFQRGKHGSTFGGNLIGCEAASAVIDFMLNHNTLEHVKYVGEKAINYLKTQTANITKVKEVRGRGFMIGIELYEPAVPYLRAIFNEKILALSAGKKIIRLLPPLVTSEDDLMDGLNKIIRVLK